MTFLARKYRLGSFNQKQNATWEFVISDEKIDEAAVRAELSSRWRWDRRTPLWRPHHRSAGLSGTRPRTLPRSSTFAGLAPFVEPARGRLHENVETPFCKETLRMSPYRASRAGFANHTEYF